MRRQQMWDHVLPIIIEKGLSWGFEPSYHHVIESCKIESSSVAADEECVVLEEVSKVHLPQISTDSSCSDQAKSNFNIVCVSHQQVTDYWNLEIFKMESRWSQFPK